MILATFFGILIIFGKSFCSANGQLNQQSPISAASATSPMRAFCGTLFLCEDKMCGIWRVIQRTKNRTRKWGYIMSFANGSQHSPIFERIFNEFIFILFDIGSFVRSIIPDKYADAFPFHSVPSGGSDFCIPRLHRQIDSRSHSATANGSAAVVATRSALCRHNASGRDNVSMASCGSNHGGIRCVVHAKLFVARAQNGMWPILERTCVQDAQCSRTHSRRRHCIRTNEPKTHSNSLDFFIQIFPCAPPSICLLFTVCSRVHILCIDESMWASVCVCVCDGPRKIQQTKRNKSYA